MKTLITFFMTFLMVGFVYAGPFKGKVATDFNNIEVGAEIQLAADEKSNGVFGVDVVTGDTRELMFNFGYSRVFDRFDVMLFTGMGLVETKINTVSTTTTTTTTSNASSNSNNGNGNNGNGNGNSGNNGNGNGNNGNGNGNGGSNNNGGTNTNTTVTNNTNTIYGTTKEVDVVQEFGLRVTSTDFDNVNPYIEATTRTHNAGFDFEQNVKIGVLINF